MLKYILFTFLTIASADIAQFTGEWTVIAMYPRGDAVVPICINITISIEQLSQHTKCNGTDMDLPVMSFMQQTDREIRVSLFAIAEDYHTVNDLYNMQCEYKDSLQKPGVLRYMRENYIILYEIQPFKTYTTKEPNNAYVLTKTLPSLDDVMGILSTDEELRNRGEPVIFCINM